MADHGGGNADSIPAESESVPARPLPRTRSDAFVARWIAVLVLLSAGGVLGVAAWLRPDPRGFGTHEQFGSGPCGMLIVTGYPCPTCGMTTAFSHTVRGQWLQAAWVQPAGFALAVGAALAAVLAVPALITGRWPPRVVRLATRPAFFITLLVLLIAGWSWKLVVGLLTGELPLR